MVHRSDWSDLAPATSWGVLPSYPSSVTHSAPMGRTNAAIAISYNGHKPV